jgi:nicotinamidase/pyrazinamidase
MALNLLPPHDSPWHVADPDARYDRLTALIVVDVQNDFADARGSLSVRGGAEIVPQINAEIATAQAHGAVVVLTADWHPAHTPHFLQDGGIWPVHCVQFTWGADFHPDLSLGGPVIYKGEHGEDGYSGFTMRDPSAGLTVPTQLDATLSAAGIKRIVVVGLATDYCVKATALDGVRLGYETAVLLDCVRAVDLVAGDGQRALEELAAAGVIVIGAGPDLS